jgi:hypothetical protein
MRFVRIVLERHTFRAIQEELERILRRNWGSFQVRVARIVRDLDTVQELTMSACYAGRLILLSLISDPVIWDLVLTLKDIQVTEL